MQVYGADVSNAFAEAPTPRAPLCVTIDRQFADWWKSKGGPPITPGHVLSVRKALQGHPESPRLWVQLINGILIKDMKLNPSTHEPCLDSGDFAEACEDETTTKAFIAAINTKLSIEFKYLGLLKNLMGSILTKLRTTLKNTLHHMHLNFFE